MTPADLARAWRAEQAEPALRAGGVVLIWAGQVYGWLDSLRPPQTEKPGVLAVDIDGRVYEASGGDREDGARVWVVVK